MEFHWIGFWMVLMIAPAVSFLLRLLDAMFLEQDRGISLADLMPPAVPAIAVAVGFIA